jgi:hypothetical protein
MELKINAGEFKVFGKEGKNFGVHAVFDGDSLTLHTSRLIVENVPYELINLDGLADGLMIGFIRGEVVKGAGLYVRATDWSATNENPAGFNFSIADMLQIRHVKVDGLKNSLSWLLQASSYDEGRPNLNGIHFQVKDSIVDMVATDGHRLGWDQSINEEDCADCDFTVSNYAIETALKLVGKKGDLGTMILTEAVSTHYPKRPGCVRRSRVSFTGIPNVVFPDAEVALQYPEFRKVVPNSGFEFSFTAEFQAVKTFVKENMKVATGHTTGRYNEKTGPCAYFAVHNDGAIVYVRDGNGERIARELRGGFTAKREPNQETGETESFEIAFNINYLKDALDGLTGEPDDTITFNCKGAASACLMQDGNRKCVLMPVRM